MQSTFFMPVCSVLTKKCSNSDREVRTTSTDWFWEEGGRAERTGLKRCFFITLVLQNSSFEVLPHYTAWKQKRKSAHGSKVALLKSKVGTWQSSATKEPLCTTAVLLCSSTGSLTVFHSQFTASAPPVPSKQQLC